MPDKKPFWEYIEEAFNCRYMPILKKAILGWVDGKLVYLVPDKKCINLDREVIE